MSAPLLRTPAFWVIGATFDFAAFGVLGLVSHFVPTLTDTGISLKEAGAIAGNNGLAMVAGRIATG